MIDIKQKIEDMNRMKRRSGSNREIERNAYFSKYNGQHRDVILKPNSNITESTKIYSVAFVPKKYTMCSGHIASRILNDFPEYIEAVAATMMETEDRQYIGTFVVEKEKFTSKITGRTSYKYIPKIKNGMPVEFDINKLKLKSFEELQAELEEAKVEEEYQKMKKELGTTMKAKARLEKEMGTTISDDEIKKAKIKAKVKKK